MKVRPNPIAEKLGTTNIKEQLEIIEGLHMAATAPVIDLVLRYDPRATQIGFSVIGGNIPTDIAKKILQAGLDQLHEQELQMALSASKTQESENVQTGSPEGQGPISLAP